MGRKFDNGVAVVSCGFNTADLSNLTITAGKKLSLEIKNVVPTTPERVLFWEHTFTVEEAVTYNGKKLDFILDSLQTEASNNTNAMPFVYFAPSAYTLVLWFVDVLDLDFVTHDFSFEYKLDTTSLIASGANRYNITIGDDYTASVSGGNQTQDMLTGGLLGFALAKF